MLVCQAKEEKGWEALWSCLEDGDGLGIPKIDTL